MANSGRGMSLAGYFWIVSGAEALCFVAWFLQLVVTPTEQYDYILAIFVGVVALVLGLIMLTVALVPNRVVHGIALALVVAPPLLIAARVGFVFAMTPSAEALAAGHGYFKGAANRALADAIVAGDSAKVTSLLSAANPNAVGYNKMTFLRLALEDGHADPDVVAGLLKAGADPDQSSQLLFGYMTESDGENGVMITDKNERLLRAVIAAGVDPNQQNQEGNPRFFSTLKWPDGLALMLDHGADPQAENKDGDTALKWAVLLRYWPAIDVLLAHGARIDHVDHDGHGLRDVVRGEVERYQKYQNDVPPELTALAERLH
jgi:hypothetical protein